MPPKKSSDPRAGLVESITSPIGFFVLALLIVEAFLATVLVGANLPETEKMTAVWAGVAMFILVVVMVFALVWFKPDNFMFTNQEHIERLRLAVRSDSPQPLPGTKKVAGPRKKTPASPPANSGDVP